MKSILIICILTICFASKAYSYPESQLNDCIASAINNAFILFANNENKEISSAKYPPKLPVTNNINIGNELNKNEYEKDFRSPTCKYLKINNENPNTKNDANKEIDTSASSV